MELSRGKKESVRAEASFLVRLRREGTLRIFVRNLRTGEEKYLSEPAGLGPYLVRQLGDEPAAAEDPVRSERSA